MQTTIFGQERFLIWYLQTFSFHEQYRWRRSIKYYTAKGICRKLVATLECTRFCCAVLKTFCNPGSYIFYILSDTYNLLIYHISSSIRNTNRGMHGSRSGTNIVHIDITHHQKLLGTQILYYWKYTRKIRSYKLYKLLWPSWANSQRPLKFMVKTFSGIYWWQFILQSHEVKTIEIIVDATLPWWDYIYIIIRPETTGYQTALYDRDKREQIFLHSWPYKAKELRLIKMRGHFLGITKPHRVLLELQPTWHRKILSEDA